MLIDADKIYHQLETAGQEWALRKADFEEKDDLTKTVLSDIQSDYTKTCKTIGESEMRARASKAYKDHLAEVSRTRRAWLLAQVKWENLKTLAELRRSQESSRRAEMSIR